jgi:predicted neuraminidase
LSPKYNLKLLRIAEIARKIETLKNWGLTLIFFGICLAQILGLGFGAGHDAAAETPIILMNEFIFDTAPFSECHASTIAESKGALVAAWFGGSGEGRPDVGIWLSRREDGRWTAPAEIADGVEGRAFAAELDPRAKPGAPAAVESPLKRYPCWNPVLFQPKAGPLMLFYKVGPGPSAWWGMMKTSADGGKTWSEACRLPDGILGPIKNKPVETAGGEMLCPSSTENGGWRVHFERTSDGGRTWRATPPVNDGLEFAAIQPTLLVHGDGRIQALGRTRQGRIFQIWSEDDGKTWGRMTATDLPNPNSGIDAVTLADGRFLLVYNPATEGRTPLSVAVSEDGEKWRVAAELENGPGEFSYPAVIQTSDGLVHITYTWKRQRVKHVVLEPKAIPIFSRPRR